MKKKIISGIAAVLVISGAYAYHEQAQIKPSSNQSVKYDKTIYFPSDKYPETAKHIQDAIKEGQTNICTIDRKDVNEHRRESLKGVATKPGYDRDEFPMAMCSEGGTGANIEYIHPADNRGAGSWVSHQVSDLPDGAKVLIEVK
jgi:hypothetical protein